MAKFTNLATWKSSSTMLCSGMPFCGYQDEFRCYHCVPHDCTENCHIAQCEEVNGMEIHCVKVRKEKGNGKVHKLRKSKKSTASTSLLLLNPIVTEANKGR